MPKFFLFATFFWVKYALRTPLMINDISRVIAGVDDNFMFLTGAGVLDEILDGLNMPYGSYF